MRTPDFLTVLVDDGILVRVDIVSEGARRCGPKMGEELVLGVEGDNREGEFLENRSGQGRRRDNGDRCFDNGGREVFNWDIRKWDAVDNFFEL